MGKRAPGSDSAGPKNKLPGQITYGSWQLSFVLNFFFQKIATVAAWMIGLDTRCVAVPDSEHSRDIWAYYLFILV
jgi:hypothetical protein